MQGDKAWKNLEPGDAFEISLGGSLIGIRGDWKYACGLIFGPRFMETDPSLKWQIYREEDAQGNLTFSLYIRPSTTHQNNFACFAIVKYDSTAKKNIVFETVREGVTVDVVKRTIGRD